MRAALVLWLLVSPPAPAALKHCLLSCYEPVGNGKWDCLYDESADACELGECVPSWAIKCRPRFVNLGTFEPRPAPADWPKNAYLSPPAPAEKPSYSPPSWARDLP